MRGNSQLGRVREIPFRLDLGFPPRILFPTSGLVVIFHLCLIA